MSKKGRFPWQVRYTYSQDGRKTQPRLYDALGMKLSLAAKPIAELVALAPEMAEVFEELADKAEMLMMMLQSEHPGAADYPVIDRARQIQLRLWHTGFQPKKWRAS